MTNFLKRNLSQIILLNICTIGTYSIYWSVITKREINQAGGKVPNAFLMIIPLINIYFWYRYAQNYVSLVKKNNEERELWVYFLICYLPTIANVVGITKFIAGELSGVITLLTGLNLSLPTISNLAMHKQFFSLAFIIVFMINLITALLISSAKLVILQEGFNDSQN